MISETKPKGFRSEFESTGCYLMHNGKILLLKRSEHDDGYHETWSTPGGKVENETPEQNIVREVKEEIGIKLDTKKLKYITKAYVIYPKHKFIYHVFIYNLDKLPKIRLSDEHSKYLWMVPRDALKLNLILDEDWCIRKAFSIKLSDL